MAGQRRAKGGRRFGPVDEAPLPSPPPEPRGIEPFRQLDQLHSLLEQLVELRDRNARLFRRVRELERLRALRRLEAELARPEPGAGPVRPKVSKWTRVKAAFRWERAGAALPPSSPPSPSSPSPTPSPSPSASASASTFSSSSSHSSASSASSSSSSSAASCCSSSSPEDDLCNDFGEKVKAASVTAQETGKVQNRPSRSLDGELIIPQNIQYATQHTKDSVIRRLEKGHKTPWGLVKDIIHARRDTAQRPLPRNSIRSEDGFSLSSLETSDVIHEASGRVMKCEQPGSGPNSEKARLQTGAAADAVPAKSGSGPKVVDLATRRLTPTLTITVPSSEELRCVSPPESMSPPTSSLQQQQQQQQRQQLDSTSMDERSPSEDREARAEGRSSAGSCRPRLQRYDTKWNKVKRAFLISASSVPPSPSRISSFFYETDGGGSYSASAEDLENNGGVSPTSANDIARNYQLLHDKLKVEFNRKLSDWEKTKGSSSSPKEKDSMNALLMSEDQLTPEFKKKLQEWKRIKKLPTTSAATTTTSSPEHQLFRRRLTDWQIWRTPTKTHQDQLKASVTDFRQAHLSEDFIRKLEEWKKIKSARTNEEQSKTRKRDPEVQTNSSGQSRKTIDEREFQPLDKVIAMIEREQRRVEKHKKKLLDTKSRLNELGGAIDSTPKKRDILIHTSTGFYKFEGISQEFKQKLYEWEKSRGIVPELSTFRLLNPNKKTVVTKSNIELTHVKNRKIANRSKSMGNLVGINQCEKNATRQRSSLSLNDITKLENEGKSRIDSKQTIGEEEMSEELALDDSEPEAVIVDIEDVIEETASPMAKLQPQQTPVYCVTASETTSIAVPLGTVTASHEPSPVILIQAGETVHRSGKHQRIHQLDDELMREESNSEKYWDNEQTENEENRKRTFEPSDINICETIFEEEMSSPHIGEDSNSGAGLASVTKAPDKQAIQEFEKTICLESAISEIPIDQINGKVVENEQLQPNRHDAETYDLSYGDPRKNSKFPLIKTDETTSDSLGENLEEIIKTSCSNTDIKNQKVTENNTEFADDVVITVSSDARPRKVLKTRRLTDTQVGYKWRQSSQKIEEISPEPSESLTVSTFPETPSVERIIINESTLNKIVVPTASNEQIANISGSNNFERTFDTDLTNTKRLTNKSEPKSVFVKTKRIIFSPFSRRSSKDKISQTIHQKNETNTNITQEESKEVSSTNISSLPTSCPPCLSEKSPNIQRSRSGTENSSPFEKRPPLPQSPILSRKEYRRSSPKETAPSIRMMIQRYNQKLQEDAGSPASSGSGSPIWRSPTSERRVRIQMEKYQEEVGRAIAGSPRIYTKRNEMGLEKSASAGIIQPTQASKLRSEILKSTSADFVRSPDFVTANPRHTESAQHQSRVIKANANKPSESKLPVQGSRKNSLQNKNPEIFSSIQQSLTQEYKTLSIKCDNSERKMSNSEKQDFDESVVTLTSNQVQQSSGGSTDREFRMSGKISHELIHKLNALSDAATEKCDRNSVNIAKQVAASENSTPLRIRAQRIKKAKDDFFSRGPNCYSHDPCIELHRFSQNSASSLELVSKSDFKSASAGMINVDPRTFERLATRTSESLPRSRDKISGGDGGGGGSGAELSGALSKIASKFRKAKLKRGKEKDPKMSTVSMLCRQSLFVDIQVDEMSKSCPTSPSPLRDDDDHSRFKLHLESS